MLYSRSLLVIYFIYCSVVGLHPTDLQALCLRSFKTKKRAQSAIRDINGLMDGGAFTSEARSWSNISPCVAYGMAGHGGTLCSPGEGEITSYRGIDVRWAY